MAQIPITFLIWDEGNIAHIARHNVLPAEVEQICHGSYIALAGKKGRLLVVGLTQKGRMITAALDPEPQEGIYYPVTARPASRKERRLYEEAQTGGGEAAA
jgi:uncharacterized DUF497 family protein